MYVRTGNFNISQNNTYLNVGRDGGSSVVVEPVIEFYRTADSNGIGDAGHIDMDNNTISNVDRLTFNDPGPNEGLSWTGGYLWKIYESPDNLTTNSAGNLQFVSGTSDRRMTLSTVGMLELPSTTGGITIAANARITAGSGNKIDFNNSSLNNVNKIFIKDPESSELGKRIIEHSILLIDEIGFDSFTFKKLDNLNLN